PQWASRNFGISKSCRSSSRAHSRPSKRSRRSLGSRRSHRTRSQSHEASDKVGTGHNQKKYFLHFFSITSSHPWAGRRFPSARMRIENGSPLVAPLGIQRTGAARNRFLAEFRW